MKFNKILITVPTLKMGGMERAVVNTASELSLQGYQVSIFLLSDNQLFYKVSSNIDIHFGKKDYKFHMLNKLLFFKSLVRLRMVCQKIKPDYVLSFSGRHSSYVILSLLGMKIKVFPFHRSNPLIKYGFIDEILRRISYPLSAGMVVQTNFAKDYFSTKYNFKNIKVVPNSVRKIDIKNITNREKIIISVGRLVKGKRIDLLIDFFHNSIIEDWKLYIIGDGDQKMNLHNKVEKLGLEASVIFVGKTNNVDKYLSRSSIFAFTSESEGFPNALLEAMCSGLACISFDCIAGPSEIIEDKINGYLVKMNDFEDYQIKLNTLMDNIFLRNSFAREALKLNYLYDSKRIIEKLIQELGIKND